MKPEATGGLLPSNPATGRISYPPGWTAKHLWVHGEFYPDPLYSVIFCIFFVVIFLAAPLLERGRKAARSRSALSRLEENRGGVLAAIAALAFIARLVVFGWGGIRRATMIQDATGYIQLAEGLRSGCGFARRIGAACAAPDVVRTPGYPIFLAAMPNLSTAIVAQALFAGIVCFLIGRFISRRFGQAAGLAAALLACFDLPSIQASSSIWSEGLFQPLIAVWVLAQLYALARSSDTGRVGLALLAGALLSVAIMVRPVGQPLVLIAPLPFLVLRSLSWRRRAALALIATTIPVLTIFGWSRRNFECCGLRTVSAISTVNLYYYRAASVLAHDSGRTFRDALADLELERQCSIVQMSDGDPTAPSPMNAKIAAEMTRRAKGIILSDPFTFTTGTLIHFAYLSLWAAGSTTQFRGFDPGSPATEALVIYQLLWSAFVWCGIFRAPRLFDRRSLRDSLMILLPLLVALLLIGLSSGPEGNARFRAPVAPLFAMVGAIGWFGMQPKGASRPDGTP